MARGAHRRERVITSKGCEKHFLTLDLNRLRAVEEVAAAREELLIDLAARGIRPVFEKIFGDLSVRQALLGGSTGRTPHPVSYIHGASVSGCPVSSVTVFGIRPHDDSVRVRYPPADPDAGFGPRGALVEHPEWSMLSLSGLRGDERLNDLEQFRDVFRRLGRIVAQSGFAAADIVRTWFYLKDILRTYWAFNRIRNHFFHSSDIACDSTSQVLPASTCVGGSASLAAAIAADVVCFKRNSARPLISRVFNSCQPEAEGARYPLQPSFSRGHLLDFGDHVELHLSGTASVDERGETAHRGDPVAQVRNTLRNVKHILEQHGLAFDCFGQVACYYKRPEYHAHFQTVLDELGVSDFSATHVVGDICRDDLLFEIDGIAIAERLDTERHSAQDAHHDLPARSGRPPAR